VMDHIHRQGSVAPRETDRVRVVGI
jgi:hypothetical protein